MLNLLKKDDCDVNEIFKSNHTLIRTPKAKTRSTFDFKNHQKEKIDKLSSILINKKTYTPKKKKLNHENNSDKKHVNSHNSDKKHVNSHSSDKSTDHDDPLDFENEALMHQNLKKKRQKKLNEKFKYNQNVHYNNMHHLDNDYNDDEC